MPEAGHVVGAKFNNAVSTLEQTIYARREVRPPLVSSSRPGDVARLRRTRERVSTVLARRPPFVYKINLLLSFQFFDWNIKSTFSFLFNFLTFILGI